MKRIVMMAVIGGALVYSGIASAKGGSTQTHHCVVGGATVEKTKKECTKAGGKWEKNEAAPEAAKPGAAPMAPAPMAPAPAK